MPKIAKITGPPGTGKTSYLLKQVALDCAKYFASKIGAVSHTVASVREIQARVGKELQIDPEDAKNIRTGHSHCFKLLEITAEQIADKPKNIKLFGDEFPEFAFDTQTAANDIQDMMDYDTLQEHRANERVFNQMQINRNKMIPVESWNDDTQDFYSAWNEFLGKHDLIDFTGMLEQTLELGLSPDIDVLYVDEYQDSSVLQCELYKMWGKQCDKVVYIGDSDQALYRFAGAVPETFSQMTADYYNVRPQSFRVPPAVHAYAQKIIRQCDNREDVEYRPRDRDRDNNPITGTFITDIEEPELTLPGSHMIICRCQYMVKDWVNYLQGQGRLYHNPFRPKDLTWNPMQTADYKAIRTYLKIVKGLEIKQTDLKKMAERCISKETMKRGLKSEIKKLMPDYRRRYTAHHLFDMGFTEAFLNFDNGDLEDFFNLKGKTRDLLTACAQSNPEWLIRDYFTKEGMSEDALFTDGAYEKAVNSLDAIDQDYFNEHGRLPPQILKSLKPLEQQKADEGDDPRVIVGTIHSVKGGEADNVWLDTSISGNIHKAITHGEPHAWDDEIRVFYVGATRAIDTLGILGDPGSNPVLRGIDID